MEAFSVTDGSNCSMCLLQWMFRVPGTPSEQLVVQDQAVFYPPPPPAPDAHAVEARIRCVQGVPWSPASHAAFPPNFRAATATLLCCHRRLAVCPQGSTAHDAAGMAGRHGRWLRRLSRQLSGQGASPRKRAEVAQGAPQCQQKPCCLGDLPKARRWRACAA